jgi:hypothetical protein
LSRIAQRGGHPLGAQHGKQTDVVRNGPIANITPRIATATTTATTAPNVKPLSCRISTGAFTSSIRSWSATGPASATRSTPTSARARSDSAMLTSPSPQA